MRELAAIVAGAAMAGSPAAAQHAAPVPEVVAERLAALDAALLAGPTATEALRRWCAEQGLAPEPRIRAEVDRGAASPASPETRRRLAVSADEPLGYRRVRLMCGEVAMSEAENWYVPGRLGADVNTQLAGSDTPFGTAIAAMAPRRMNLAVERLWRPGQGAVPAAVLRHRALVFDGAGRPLAEVVETYQRGALGL